MQNVEPAFFKNYTSKFSEILPFDFNEQAHAVFMLYLCQTT